MKLTILHLFSVAALLAAPAVGQQAPSGNPSGNPPVAKALPAIDSALYALGLAAREPDFDVLVEVERHGLIRRADGRINVEVVAPEGAPAIGAAFLARFGGEVQVIWRHRTNVWIAPEFLINTANSLPGGVFLEVVRLPDLDGPAAGTTFGEELTNSSTYIDGGDGGSGISVAVIDCGFENLSAATANGWAPSVPAFRRYNYSGGAFEDNGSHGTFCLQTVFDHAPSSTYYLFKVCSLAQFGAATDQIAALGIDVTSHSISRYNLGWGDNSGDACAGVATVAGAGGIFFTSAGNRAETHWQGDFDDGQDNDVWHDFVNGDELLDMVIGPGSSMNCYLAWETAGGTTDYDFYLYDAAVNVLLSSTNAGEAFESFSYTNNSAGPQQVYLAVRFESGPVREMELFVHKTGSVSFQFPIASGSTTSPSNSTHPRCMSIGAVGAAQYDSPAGSSGIIKDYSSRGPSNLGMLLPDLSGPTDTDVNSGGTFTGTSCATPNVAGAAAALWSSAPFLDAEGVRRVLIANAEIFKDWGTSDADNVYGNGGVFLFDHYPDTVWIDRSVGNLAGLSTRPFYLVADAQAFVPAGGRLAFLSPSYPEPVSLFKEMRLETVGPVIPIGQ